MEEAVKLLERLLAIPSVNGRDDEGKMAEFLCGFMRESGLEAQVQRIDDTHANVMAVLEGREDRASVVWNGHLDTVPYGKREEWQTDPAVPVRKDGFLYGRGASDMKSGLAAMVWALCACARSGKKPRRTVRFFGTCDEERGGLGALKLLEAGLFGEPEEVLIAEPTGCRMGVAQKGCLWLEMKAGGRTSHGAYPQEGVNAVDGSVALAAGLKRYVEHFSHPVLGHSTAQITQISGGTAPNMTPDSCTLLMDIRMVPGLTREMVLGEAESLLKKASSSQPGFSAEFFVRNSRMAIEIGLEHPMTRRLKESLINHGLEAGLAGLNFFTDASILIRDRAETPVLLFGPGEPDMAHKPDERVELKKYEAAVSVFSDMLEAEEI